MRPIFATGGVVVMALCFSACARSDPSTPAMPDDAAGAPSVQASFIMPANRALLGLYSIHISADRSSIEIIPDRALALHVNAVRMLEVDPCTGCLTVEEIIAFGQGRVLVRVQLKHPFSSEHRALTGFDVRGIVMFPGSFEFPAAGVTVSREELGDPVLVGADGYTRLFNPVEFGQGKAGPPALHYIKGRFADPNLDGCTLNPYLVFVPQQERNHFPAGASASRTYDFKLPPGPVSFGYAVDASWYPVDGPVENVPDDLPFSANSLEAYKVRASIGKGLTPTGTGTARVMIEVFDWQGVDTIDKVLIEAPDLFVGEVEGALSTVGDESAIFYAHIQNSKHAPIGDYPLLVTVSDTEVDPNLGSIAGYQVITAHVTLTGVWIRELVHIPAGDFIMGGDPDFDPQALSTEQPQHIHPTGEYYISRFEISNEEYAAFIADGGYFNPIYWSDEGWKWRVQYSITSPEGWNMWPEKSTRNGIDFPDYPTMHLCWFEAEAFCNWASGRLPTEAEWEKAARGTDGRIWPWGNEWNEQNCQCNKNGVGPAPVGAHSPQGDSPYHLADAVGNAREWVSDWFDWYVYERYAAGDFSPPQEPWPYAGHRGVRGGAYWQNYASRYLRTSARHSHAQYSQMELSGVRIAYDP